MAPVVVDVTPHTGVWIETTPNGKEHKKQHVTPHTGVWIETSQGYSRV